MSVSEWQELESWYSHVKSLQTGQVGSGGLDATAFTIHYDINQIRYGNMILAEWSMENGISTCKKPDHVVYSMQHGTTTA